MKKLLALVLALVMTLGLATVGANAAFSDADSITYKEAVDVMSAIGVLDGQDGKFNPTGTLTREQGAKIIAYMILGKTAADGLSTAAAPFTDVAADRWSAGAIAYASSEKIIGGVGNNQFNPEGQLTGYAFAKMLLVALGYDPEIEGFGGSDWSINVAKIALSAGLNDDLTGLVMSQGITREQAAQMALNTEKGVLVRYTGGTSITTSDGTHVNSGAVRSEVPSVPATEGQIAADGFKNFAEQYETNLTFTAASAASVNDNGQPSNKWTYKNREVGAYPVSPAFTYTQYMNNTSGKATVKADLGKFQVTAALGVAYGIGGTAAQQAVDTDDVAAVTNNGKIVEIYVKNNVIYAVDQITPILTTVTKVEAKKVTLKQNGAATTYTIEDSEDLWSFASGLEKDDRVIITVLGTKVTSAYEPTEVTGKLTKFANAAAPDAAYTVGGTVYPYASGVTGAADDDIDAAGDIGETRAIYLDQFGFIVDSDTVTSTKTYAFVLDTSESITRGVYDWSAKLLFTDGTMAWVDVAKIGGTAVEDKTTGDLDALKYTAGTTGFVSYTETDGKYDLTAATTVYSASASHTKNSTAVTIGAGYTATTKTVFLIKNANKSYDVYTGIKEAPGLDTAVAWGQNNSGVLSVVVIDSAATSSSDQIFIYNQTGAGTSKDGNTKTLTTYKAIVNGELTTIDVLTNDGGATNTDLAEALWSSNSYDSKGYVVDLGTKENTSTTPAGNEKDKWVVATQAEDGFANVTLKDGVVTFDLTTDRAYVAAEGFKAWQIDLTAGHKAAQAITLDDTDTVAELGVYGAAAWDTAWTLATGDYAVFHVDDDGFITDLYLVNAA